jgi:FAD/FMN-containing dehydrogenase
VVLVGVPTVDEAMALAAALRAGVDGLDALEAVMGDGIALVVEQLGLPVPIPIAASGSHGVALLVEWAGRGDPPAALDELLGPYPSAAATDDAGRARLWRYREAMPEAIARVGVPHKLDVTLPASALAIFAGEVPGVIAATVPSARLHLFGHLGDGNLHVNITGVDPDDDAVDDAVLRLVARYGGSISAEHGIGRSRLAELEHYKAPIELDMMRSLKRALDPQGIMNPGKILRP